jgi:hypothetical protein
MDWLMLPDPGRFQGAVDQVYAASKTLALDARINPKPRDGGWGPNGQLASDLNLLDDKITPFNTATTLDHAASVLMVVANDFDRTDEQIKGTSPPRRTPSDAHRRTRARVERRPTCSVRRGPGRGGSGTARR